MKIAVFGSNGMAGSMVTSYLKKQNYNVITLARNNSDINVDIENQNQLSDVVKQLVDVDYIVNCIGLLVKDSNERPDRAAIINSWFPHYLEYTFKNTNIKVIHLSTDCVFDGIKGHYREQDIHTEMNSYGSSKSLGEINNDKDITFRMSIIGPELKENGTGLLNFVLNNKSDTLNGFVDAYWNGITTLQLAKCIEQYIKTPNITGVYHVVNNDVFTSKYDLLCLINEVYNLNKTIKKSTGPKPVNKILLDTKMSMNFDIPDYKTQLMELKNYHI